MNPKKGEGYFYYFHNRKKRAAGKEVYFISGIGAGGQYMATFPKLNIVAVATAHNKKQIGLFCRRTRRFLHRKTKVKNALT